MHIRIYIYSIYIYIQYIYIFNIYIFTYSLQPANHNNCKKHQTSSNLLAIQKIHLNCGIPIHTLLKTPHISSPTSIAGSVYISATQKFTQQHHLDVPKMSKQLPKNVWRKSPNLLLEVFSKPPCPTFPMQKTPPTTGTKKVRFIKRCTTKFHLRPQKSRSDVESNNGDCIESTESTPQGMMLWGFASRNNRSLYCCWFRNPAITTVWMYKTL